MQTRSIIGVLVVCVLAGGCSDSKPGPQPVPAETPEPVAPPDVVADSSDQTPLDLGANITPSPSSDDDSLAQSSPTESSAADSAQTERSLENMFQSVGRVMFGGSGEEASDDDQPEADAGGRSVMESVGRALSKAAVEAAQQAPSDDDE